MSLYMSTRDAMVMETDSSSWRVYDVATELVLARR